MMRSSASKKSSFKFRYQGRTEKQVRERATMSSGSYDRFVKDGTTVFKPKSGDNVIRILPPGWENAKHFGLDLWVHNGIGPDRASYLCAFKMKGEPCPICEGRQYATTDDESSALKPTRRVGVYLLDRDDMKLGPQFWSMPAEKMDKEIIARCFNKKTKRVLMVDHPDEGYDVEFIKEGEKRNTVYRAVEISRDQSPISRNETRQQEILKYVTQHAIPKILKFYDYDYIEQVFNAKQPEKDSKMARRKAALKKDTAPKKRGRGRSIDEDEDDLDEIDEDELEEALDELDDEDEDEDEDPAPRRRRAKKAAPAKAKSKRRKKVVEEEDEDDDDDDLDDELDDLDDEDEDEEPAPRKKRATRVRKKKVVEEEDEDEDDDDLDDLDDDEDDDLDDLDDDEDDEDEDEDEEPAPKKRRAVRAKKAAPVKKKASRRRR